MAINVTLSEDAYEQLVRLKRGPGDSFSKVILRHFRPPADTAGELLDRLERLPVPALDDDALDTLTAGRGRRRKARP